MRHRQSLLISCLLVLCACQPGTPRLSAQGLPDAAPSDAQPLRVYSREVLVDINVTDSKGNPVHGLTQNDFTVTENGRPIVPRSFREHRNDQHVDLAAAPGPSTPPNTFTNAGPPESTLPLNVLLIDSLDTPLGTQSIVQKRLVDFVDKAAPGTRIAVFALSSTGQLSLIQGFTSDQSLLRSAIKSKKFNLQIPPMEDYGQEPDEPTFPDISPSQPKTKAAPPPKAKIDYSLECNHAAVRGEDTLDAIGQIARYLSGMPGRKNLIWYTGAFPLRMRDKGSLCMDLTQQMQDAESALGNSHVAVFPVDSRALDALAKNDPMSYPVRQQVIEHGTMDGIAESTGGKSFYNNNDLAAAAQQAVDAGSNYYSITYAPPNPNSDTRLRTIAVTVDQPNLTLLYKNGYHALPQGIALNGKPTDKASPAQSAMLRGAIQPTEILFHVSVAAAPATESTLLPGNKSDPKAMKPPYRHLTLSYNIDLNNMQFDPAPDGSYHGQFEYAVNVYESGGGNLVNSSIMAAKPALPAAVYQSMLTTGAKLRQEIDIPAKGDYTLRIGIHDLTSDRVGAIEIPTSAIHP